MATKKQKVEKENEFRQWKKNAVWIDCHAKDELFTAQVNNSFKNHYNAILLRFFFSSHFIYSFISHLWWFIVSSHHHQTLMHVHTQLILSLSLNSSSFRCNKKKVFATEIHFIDRIQRFGWKFIFIIFLVYWRIVSITVFTA